MNTARRFPAEWEPQSALLITWPHADTDWGAELADIEPVYCSLATAVLAVQPLIIVCRDEPHARHIRNSLQQRGANVDNLRPVPIPFDDTWIRDYGPLGVVEDGRIRLLDFRFDGWGGKHRAEQDNAVNGQLQALGLFGDLELLQQSAVLEGGSIDTDGAGTLLTTSRCLLQASRNPRLQRTDWERLFARELGCDRVLWLEHGYLQGDDTDGHVDTLARFCDPQTIAHASCDNTIDPNYDELQRMAMELKQFRCRAGKPYRLVALPSPTPIPGADGRCLPASYANFIIINQCVIMPEYGDPADATARRILAGCFPDLEIVGVNALAMVRQGGSLHCASMQLPRTTIGL